MNIKELTIKKKNHQTHTGYSEREMRKVRTNIYDFYLKEELVAHIELEIMDISKSHPEDIAETINFYKHTYWTQISRYFDRYSDFNSSAIDKGFDIQSYEQFEDDEFGLDGSKYVKAGLIEYIFIHPSYRRQNLGTQLLQFIFKKHYECGVFFLLPFDLKDSLFIKNNYNITDDSQLSLIQKLNKLHLSEMPDLQDLQKFYSNLGFKRLNPNNSEVDWLYIEPLDSLEHCQLFKTEKQIESRFKSYD